MLNSDLCPICVPFRRIIWPLRFLCRTLALCSTFPRRMEERKRENLVVATLCRGLASKEVISARRHYSSRPVQPLFLDRESIPSSELATPPPFIPRACINHETPGILSRQCETSVILAAPASPFFPAFAPF